MLCLFIIPVPPEDKQDVQRSTEWAITQSVGGRENSHFLFGSRIPMIRRAVSALMCGVHGSVLCCVRSLVATA